MKIANLELIIGDDNLYPVEARRDDQILDLTYYTIKFVAKNDRRDADVDAVLDLDGQVVSPTEGQALIFVPRDISEDLTEGILQYDIRFTDTDEDKVSTGVTGRLTVIRTPSG